jgi:hypothetical protein
MNMYKQYKNNPMQFLAQRFNIPTGIQNPQDIVQHLLNSGQISQAQLNQVMQMRNDPQIRDMFR